MREPVGLGASLAVIEPSGSAGVTAPEPGIPQEPISHADILARLMDFPGGMKVAEFLEAEPGSTRERHPEAAALGERLERDVEARLDALERNAMAPLLGARAPSLPGAEELFDAYRAAGLEAGVSDAAFQRFSEMAGAPLRAAVGASMRQSMVQVGTLRWEVQDDLRALGPAAERIDRLDALVHAATQSEVRALFDRVELALSETWAAACHHALGSLPPEAGTADFAQWLEGDGWLERFQTRCVRAARAVYVHLRRNLEGLIKAAVMAEES